MRIILLSLISHIISGGREWIFSIPICVFLGEVKILPLNGDIKERPVSPRVAVKMGKIRAKKEQPIRGRGPCLLFNKWDDILNEFHARKLTRFGLKTKAEIGDDLFNSRWRTYP